MPIPLSDYIRFKNPIVKDEKLWKNTKRVISNGVQTLSKAPNKFVEGSYPIYVEHASGCYLYDRRGFSYIDYPCSLGAILLGYNVREVNDAVKSQIDRGFIYTLPSYLETELALKIKELIPCAEKVRFLKTGSEATSAAVKIARSYTGREHIICCGYHGWHDWYTASTLKNKGIPDFYKYRIHKAEYNNIKSFEDLFNKYKNEVACVILEPYIYDEPKNKFLNKLRDLAHKNGSLLIFDEVVTGFRTLNYSAQKMFGIIPDLSCFGKAMANGLPISVVCGRKRYMDELEGDCFVSSTFGGELLSIASALKTLEILDRDNVIENIWGNGYYLKNGYNEIAKKIGCDTQCIGFPNRTIFVFPSGEHKSLFWEKCVEEGIIFGYAQFISNSHTHVAIDYTLQQIEKALRFVKANWDNPKKKLKGKPATEVFRLVALKK